MTKNLTLGTAKITREGTGFCLTYMNHTNFSVGERFYGHEEDAREFCRERNLRII